MRRRRRTPPFSGLRTLAGDRPTARLVRGRHGRRREPQLSRPAVKLGSKYIPPTAEEARTHRDGNVVIRFMRHEMPRGVGWLSEIGSAKLKGGQRPVTLLMLWTAPPAGIAMCHVAVS